MHLFLYNLFISTYFIAIRIAGLFNNKAKQWHAGRRDLFNKLKNDFKNVNRNRDKVIWMHCASLGEFEQGRTIIERLKTSRPDIKILITFFSPSGYEIRKSYDLTDWVYYLPIDTKQNAKKFISIVKPHLVLFIKNEFWYHHLNELKQTQVPIYLIAASFRSSQPFFKWYGKMHKEMLTCFETIFVQDQLSKNLINPLVNCNIILAGDPRIDRVVEVAESNIHLPKIEQFCDNHPVLIGGSTWEKEEDLLLELLSEPMFKDWKVIIVPHEVSHQRIGDLVKKFGNECVILSSIEQSTAKKRVLIVDQIGLLSKIYKYGKIAVIGGGFGKGIHNTLEPMAFGLPVIYGPNWKKFVEAKNMVASGGHFSILNYEEFRRVMERLLSDLEYSSSKSKVNQYIKESKGATQAIFKAIQVHI